MKLKTNELDRDHIYQKRNAKPRPINNFWNILITFILVKFNGLRKKVESKINARIKKKNEFKILTKFNR